MVDVITPTATEMVSHTTPLSPVLLRAPMVERETLLLSRPWQQWFLATFERVGGANAPANTTLAVGVVTNAGDIAQLQEDVGDSRTAIADLESDVVVLEARVTTSEGAIDTLQSDLATLASTTQPLDATLTTLAALATAPDTLPYFTGVDTAAVTTLTAFARTFLDDTDATTARATLGLTPGTDVQPYDAELAALAGLVSAADSLPYFTGVGTAALTPLSAFARTVLDDTTQGTMRTTLGLGTGDSPAFLGLAIDSPTLVVDSATHRVGIGTATPGHKLSIESTGSGDYLRIGNTTRNAFVAIDGSGAMLASGAGETGQGVYLNDASTYLALLTSGTMRLTVDGSGNVGIGTGAQTFGTSAARVLAMRASTAPTTSIADQVQLWEADRGATAGKGSLFLRTEDGTSHVFGDLVGLSTLLTATLGSGASYQALNVRGSTLYVGQSSAQERALALVAPSFVVSTDASRTARLALSVYDATAAREGVRIETSGTAAMLGFYGGAAAVKPTVTGSRGANAALASLLTALATLGLLTDSSTV